MAKTGRIRRRHRRKAPPVRRQPDTRTAQARDDAQGLIVGGMRDPAEKAADRMAADALSGGPVSAQSSPGSPAAVHRMCKECEDENRKKVKREAHTGATLAGGAASAPASKTAAKAVSDLGAGSPLPPSERSFFEPRFGQDFSGVRIHEGPTAARATDALSARAFALGPDIAFAPGERTTPTLAHELAHVAQGGAAVRRAPNCDSKTDPNAVLTTHNVKDATIDRPADTASVDIGFDCAVRSYRSEWIDSSGTVVKTNLLSGSKTKPLTTGRTETWDGKKQFKGVGTFTADDGTYRHQIRDVAYAPGATGDKMVNGGGVVSTVGPVDLQVRSKVMKGLTPTAAEQAATAGQTGPNLTFMSMHLVDDKRVERTANVTGLANAMESEGGVGEDSERTALAWAIRNEMVRVNTNSVRTAKSAFNFVDNKTGSAALQTKAREILAKPMSDDITSGAIKWYSPRSMPPHKGSCKPNGKADCSGGDVTTTDGTKFTSKAPGFHKSMTFVDIPGVRQSFFRFYKL